MKYRIEISAMIRHNRGRLKTIYIFEFAEGAKAGGAAMKHRMSSGLLLWAIVSTAIMIGIGGARAQNAGPAAGPDLREIPLPGIRDTRPQDAGPADGPDPREIPLPPIQT
jgi:hypothetical protein